MKKVYIFIYTGRVGTREEVKDVIDSIPEIIAWRSEIPHSFYIVSESNADFLADIFLQRLGKKGLFLVSEISNNYQGWLPKRTWHLLNKKELPPKEK